MTYGSNTYSSGPYGGGTPPIFSTAVPVTIEHFDNTLGYKGAFQTGAGDFSGVQFTVDESGSRDFVLFFASPQDINKTDIIKIKLFNQENYFFTGVIRKTPISGSTKSEYNYTGFGLNDYLVRVNAENQSYSTKTIQEILDNLLDNIVVPKTPIIKNSAKITPPNIVISSFTVNYNQIPDVLDSLRKIANSTGTTYITGVDETGEFFFKEKELDVKTTLVVGSRGENGIAGYEPEDEYQALSKLFILDDNGVLVTTLSTTEDNDIFEEKVLAPQLDNAGIINWGKGILSEKEINRRSAGIIWKIEEQEPLQLLGQGSIRIISNVPPENFVLPSPNPYGSGLYGSGLYGGGQSTWGAVDDTLQVMEVTYVLNGSESTRSITLGALPVELERQINELRKKRIELEINLGK